MRLPSELAGLAYGRPRANCNVVVRATVWLVHRRQAIYTLLAIALFYCVVKPGQYVALRRLQRAVMRYVYEPGITEDQRAWRYNRVVSEGLDNQQGGDDETRN